MNTPRSFRIRFGSWSLGMCCIIKLMLGLSLLRTRSDDWFGLSSERGLRCFFANACLVA